MLSESLLGGSQSRISNPDETTSLLYQQSGSKQHLAMDIDYEVDTEERDGKKKKKMPKPTVSSWNERIGFKFNKFWLFRVGLRLGYSRIHTICMGELLFGIFLLANMIFCMYLVGDAFYYGHSSKFPIYGGISLHSGLSTGIYYGLTIILSLRYPFYWKWGLFMIGFDRQMRFHRICAYLGAICCIFHILDNYKTLWTYKALTGWGCYGFAILLLIFAANYFRRKHYNGIFIYSHWIFIIGFIVLGWMHNAILVIYGTFIIIIDVVIRIFDNQFRATKITNIALLDYDRVVKIEFEKKGFEYRAGQYVFIRFPDLGFFEFHPFSLSSYPGSGKTCSLHIKSSIGGKFTAKLATYMKMNEGKKDLYKNIRVQVEGPYGELTLSKELYRYEHVVFIGGGIGVTPLDSLFNQLVTDLLCGNLRREAKTRCIDFIFTTRSRSLITEFASRNKAWQIAEQDAEVKSEAARIESSINPLADMRGVQMKEVEQYQDAIETRKVLTGHMNLWSRESRQKSLLLTAEDHRVGHNKAKNIRFRKSDAGDSDEEEEEESLLSSPGSVRSSTASQTQKVANFGSLNVEKLDITNSTHITRVKDKELRKFYRTTFPFINFDRPNIRGIIYGAASKTKSKSVCVITSGPKSMIQDCKRWGAEIGVDVHYEVFDW